MAIIILGRVLQSLGGSSLDVLDEVVYLRYRDVERAPVVDRPHVRSSSVGSYRWASHGRIYSANTWTGDGSGGSTCLLLLCWSLVSVVVLEDDPSHGSRCTCSCWFGSIRVQTRRAGLSIPHTPLPHSLSHAGWSLCPRYGSSLDIVIPASYFRRCISWNPFTISHLDSTILHFRHGLYCFCGYWR